jgi:hypothetical protein
MRRLMRDLEKAGKTGYGPKDLGIKGVSLEVGLERVSDAYDLILITIVGMAARMCKEGGGDVGMAEALCRVMMEVTKDVGDRLEEVVAKVKRKQK